ncbi:hypothetical protein EVAR_57606_1 [Eumeta japonica]|uniref:Uncharacterized protein n=1 Tax=Eumeta variegata TaxID=151549 RepID=A0A4C1XYH6_EUMVA|nr:hypothetical protein EVAR_57606_1 [Eumeta japonica]
MAFLQNRSISLVDMYIDNSEPSENVGQIHFSLEYDFQNTTLILKIIQVCVYECCLVGLSYRIEASLCRFPTHAQMKKLTVVYYGRAILRSTRLQQKMVRLSEIPYYHRIRTRNTNFGGCTLSSPGSSLSFSHYTSYLMEQKPRGQS